MKALVMAAVAALVTVNAWAADEGKTAATKICNGLFGQEEKIKCVGIVGKAKYFDEAAVKVCNGLFGQDEKISCLGVCADKTYGDGAVKICSGLFGQEEKIKCLDKAGKKAGKADELSVDEREETILVIDRVLKNLENGDADKAERNLKALRRTLDKKSK